MKKVLKMKSIQLALCLAFPAVPMHALAADAYPGQPPYLAASVTPNIMLFIDTSASMLQKDDNGWMNTINGHTCNNAATNWSNCIDNNTDGWRTAVDTAANTKMNIAKRVATSLIDNNRHLRFGLFSFRDNQISIGNSERDQSAILRRGITDVSSLADRNALVAALDGIYGRTATPLGEGLLEITRYYAGQSSLYGLRTDNYTSPIQYRCQRNFTIVITDGDATNDQNLPGTGAVGNDGNPAIAAIPYVSRDSSGTAVPRMFSVCTAVSTADDTYNVTCPSTYESNGAFRGFGDVVNRPSALRDVAMYANRADFRVDGTDLDGKSFDDPKFAKQNMITYTVGFAVDNAVLPSAAIVGGGKYYNATNEAQLTASLNDAVSSIGNVVSNAGGGATSGATLGVADKMFQPLFHATGWHGELRCHQLDTAGAVTGPCAPNAGAVIPSHADRSIYSAKVEAGVGGSVTTTPFAFNTATGIAAMSADQRNSLGVTPTERQNVVNFIRGQDIPGFRTRPNGVLGDIVDGQPVVVAKSEGESSDGDYAAFKLANESRGMVFIGANDGMLHGFSTANMTEFFGFVPSAVYPQLKRLTGIDYGNGATNPHTYYVNGVLRQQDLKLGGSWKTLLVGGLAQGGQGYFALDATSQSAMSSASAVKWEFTDKNDASLGYTFGTPIIYNVRTSASTAVPAVIVANGYKSDYADGNAAARNSTLYILDAGNGSLLKKLTAPSGTGLSSPAGVDYPANGVLDYVYAGDDSGKLWRFDLTPDSIGVSGAAAPEPKLIFDAGPDHPIIIRPAVQVVKRSDGTLAGNLVMFGTGALLTDSDRTNTKTQTIYAVLDKLQDADTTVSVSSLVQRSVEATASVSGTNRYAGTYRKISTLPALDLTNAANDKLGWYLDLPVTSERLVTIPILLSDRLLFGTGITISTEQCSPGKGWLMGLNPMTGSVTMAGSTPFSFIDVQMDGRADTQDKVNFGIGIGGGSTYPSGLELSGIPTNLTVLVKKVVYPTFSSDDPFIASSPGIALMDQNLSGVFGGGGPPPPPPPEDHKCVPIPPVVPYVCIKGEGDCIYIPPSVKGCGFKVETSIWREIK